ncbi:MAG: enterotoxin (HBL) [Desulfarculus sp.]|nr:enterotoxin (HBL) [Desulfarculus sp.]
MNATTHAPLTLAIRKNMPTLAQATSDYQTNVVTVNTYINNVLSSSLPVVTPQPKDWQQYVTAWEQASSDALVWVNQCMARLLSVPQDVQSYNPIISALMTDAINQTNILIKNPNDKAALAALTNDLTQIPTQLYIVETFITGAIQALQNFQDVLPDMAAQQIQALQQQINQLQSDINSLTAAIIGLGIADAAAITLGVIASIVAFPVGLVTWFVLGPAVAVATTYIVLDAKQIQADKAAIDQAQSQMSQLTNACAILATLTTQFSNLATQSQTIQTALQAVLAAWQTMASDITAAITDAQKAMTDKTASNFQAVLNDLQGAQTEWQATEAQAASMVLNLQVNNANLQIGMSQSSVASALQGGKVVPLIQYFNSVGTAKKAA